MRLSALKRHNYSQEEIDYIIESLLLIYRDKLKPEEVTWLQSLRAQNVINQKDRDTLIAMYDRIGEASY